MKNNIHPVEAEQLMAYLDGELPVERATATAAHLRECLECQILAADLKNASESLAAWEIEPKELQITAELAEALSENDTKPKEVASEGHSSWLGLGRFGRLTPFLGGALLGGVAMLLVAFTLIFSGTREHAAPQYSSSSHASSKLAQSQMAASVGDQGGERDRLETGAANLRDAQSVLFAQRKAQADISSNLETRPTRIPPAPVKAESGPPAAPMILRTAQVTLVTRNLDKARAGIEQIVMRYSGYVGDLTTSSPTDGARKLTATLRVPSAQLDAATAELKTLGRVESESQSGQDVTAQYVDLEARLSNARNTEQRLIDLLRLRTGKLSDVLEVETELSRVREEIERMEGERRLLSKQVEYATLNATIAEEYKAPSQALPDSTGTRFRNAAIDGYQSVVNFIIAVALFFISDGPMLLLWIAILFFPARYAWKKLRNRDVPPSLQ